MRRVKSSRHCWLVHSNWTTTYRKLASKAARYWSWFFGFLCVFVPSCVSFVVKILRQSLRPLGSLGDFYGPVKLTPEVEFCQFTQFLSKPDRPDYNRVGNDKIRTIKICFLLLRITPLRMLQELVTLLWSSIPVHQLIAVSTRRT